MLPIAPRGYAYALRGSRLSIAKERDAQRNVAVCPSVDSRVGFMREDDRRFRPFQPVPGAAVYRCDGPCGHRYRSDVPHVSFPLLPADCEGRNWVLVEARDPAREGTARLDRFQQAYLNAHSSAVLGTGRRDGSPQLSLVGYVYNGTHIDICVERYRAKWHNASRHPRLALLVADGSRQLVVYGTALLLDAGEESRDALRQYFAAIQKRSGTINKDAVDQFLGEDRGIIRITPTRAYFTGIEIPNG